MQSVLKLSPTSAPALKSPYIQIAKPKLLQEAGKLSSQEQAYGVELEELYHFIHQSISSALHEAKQQTDFNYWYSKDRNQRKVEEALSYIDEHFHEDFGLEQATDIMHCSSTYLNRLLKQYTGSTFYNLLTQKRIEHSKHLLAMDLQTVWEISSEVGYTNVHSFIRAFKRSVGVTPGHFRESCLVHSG
ncbi:AraC family transcriptional regulator [Paenibacillus sp. CF384]|uniref:helix-turn-helix domain-containing protein n=1 Tax=Paenibacillus sp. CF384 TaxID=1884382 RepID=UPI000896F0D0|nr:AraC family transcriptional regulator [Paenibacillus sp. CF384]SDW16371.1 two-component system, response regulator YesN [Paenibacillus sp. CF384]